MSILYCHKVRHSHSEMSQHSFSHLCLCLCWSATSYQLNHKSLYFDCSSFWFFYAGFFQADGSFFRIYVIFLNSFLFLACSSHLTPMKPLKFYIISAFFRQIPLHIIIANCVREFFSPQNQRTSLWGLFCRRLQLSVALSCANSIYIYAQRSGHCWHCNQPRSPPSTEQEGNRIPVKQSTEGIIFPGKFNFCPFSASVWIYFFLIFLFILFFTHHVLCMHNTLYLQCLSCSDIACYLNLEVQI